jgi:hypothetical protein
MGVWWFISAFACLIATLASLSMAVSGILMPRRRDRWQSSRATVIRHGTRLVNTGPGGGYYAATSHYSIASYTDLSGTEHTIEVSERPTGSTVPILFDPRRPARACEDSDFMPVTFLICLAIAAITGLLLYLIPRP